MPNGPKNAKDGKVTINYRYLLDMIDWVKGFAQERKSEQTEQLKEEERHLVAAAYKYYTGSRRAAWRVLTSI